MLSDTAFAGAIRQFSHAIFAAIAHFSDFRLFHAAFLFSIAASSAIISLLSILFFIDDE